MSYAIGNVLDVLPTLDAGRFQCCVTSPPYWGLRDYGHAEQLGMEPTPAEYVASMVRVFGEVRRVLADDGVMWLNVGDSYASTTKGSGCDPETSPKQAYKGSDNGQGFEPRRFDLPDGIKPKDLVGIPWLLAFALRADGWYLRSDTIWHKPNPMPESVTDRPTKAHEYVFLLSKRATYFYDADAIREEMAHPDLARKAVAMSAANVGRVGDYQRESGRNDGGEHISGLGFKSDPDAGRNARSVWTIASQPFAGAHFATMPPQLAQRCILAGSRVGDEVLDPFLGSGTVGMVAERNGRRWFGVELNPKYEAIIKQRTAQAGLFGRPGGCS